MSKGCIMTYAEMDLIQLALLFSKSTANTPEAKTRHEAALKLVDTELAKMLAKA